MTGSHAPRLARGQMCCRPPGATGLRATKWCLPDKEEVRGSNPRAPTSDLQGFLPIHIPPEPPSAILLQPKCSGVDGTGTNEMRLVVTLR
jgi:hypothetical protein